VATVAQLLDCHPTDVRRLVHSGELQTHRKGVRGVRVFLDSVQAYQERQTHPAPRRVATAIHPLKRPFPPATVAFRAAMAGLKAKGLA
jgi:excisionase family DNA binding protein